jgi:Cu/Ag efflux protein CusF
MRYVKIVAAFVMLAGLCGAGTCSEEKTTAPAQAQAPAVPQFEKVFGTVSSIDSQTLVVTLKEPLTDGQTTASIAMTEWSRVVRENEDLTVNDLKPGLPVEVVCEVKDGRKEAVMVCLLP